MRGEKTIATGVLFVALLACNAGIPRSIGWEPYSATVPHNVLTDRAVHVGVGDLETLRDVGAMALGTMTMNGINETSTSEEAAGYGATHYVLGRLRGSSLAPSSGKQPSYVLYRVAPSSWDT